MLSPLALAIFAFLMAFMNDALGGGYGTLSSPLLLLFGYSAKVAVPSILFSEAWSEGRTEAVFSSNFSIGLNFVGTLVRSVSHLPEGFDASIVEIHHTGKADSPSGTALQLSELVKEARGYTKEVFGRTRNSKRMVPRTQTGWRQGPRP